MWNALKAQAGLEQQDRHTDLGNGERTFKVEIGMAPGSFVFAKAVATSPTIETRQMPCQAHHLLFKQLAEDGFVKNRKMEGEILDLEKKQGARGSGRWQKQ